MLLAVRHAKSDEFTFKPNSDTPLESDMTLVVMADAEGHERLQRGFQRATGMHFKIEHPDEDG